MTTRVRVRRTTGAKVASPLPKTVTDRTDRLVEISSHCAAAREVAEAAGEDFLVYLLSMAIVESQAGMRRATLGAPPPTRKSRCKPS